MKILLPFASSLIFVLLSCFSFGQLPFSGTKTVNSSQNMTLNVFIDTVADTVEIIFSGPVNKWRGIGFGGSSMTNTYAIITDGNGNVTERKMGNHNAGTLLSNSLTSVSHSTVGSISTTRVTRNLTGLTADHFTFPSGSSTISLIWAYGNGINLAYHGGRGATTISITPDCTNSNTSNTLNPMVCESYLSPLGNTYTSSGTYIETLPNSVGCDSVITINLSVNATSSDITTTACKEYTAPSGIVYSQSGTYNDTILNSAGCDSVITIELEILESFSNISLTSCNSSVISQSGNQIWSNSGTYTDTITNSSGCDSIMTVALTLLQSSNSSISVDECNTYTSPSGVIYNQSGVYNDTIQNADGCDSIIEITLQITNVDYTVNVTFNDPNFPNHVGEILNSAQPNATYQWIDCDNGNLPLPGETNQQFAASDPGSYAVIVSEANCSDTSDCITVTLLSVVEPEQISMEYYPNPSQSEVFFEFSGEINSAQINVFSVSGQLISSWQLNGAGTKGIILPSESGVYFAKVQIDKEDYKTVKLIKY